MKEHKSDLSGGFLKKSVSKDYAVFHVYFFLPNEWLNDLSNLFFFWKKKTQTQQPIESNNLISIFASFYWIVMLAKYFVLIAGIALFNI